MIQQIEGIIVTSYNVDIDPVVGIEKAERHCDFRERLGLFRTEPYCNFLNIPDGLERKQVTFLKFRFADHHKTESVLTPEEFQELLRTIYLRPCQNSVAYILGLMMQDSHDNLPDQLQGTYVAFDNIVQTPVLELCHASLRNGTCCESKQAWAPHCFAVEMDDRGRNATIQPFEVVKPNTFYTAVAR